jgi:hypothetical protein
MIAMLPATVWTKTFSTGEKGNLRWRETVLKKPKPSRLAGMLMVLTQPVWSPKYMLEKQMTRPTRRPTARPRAVKLRPSIGNVLPAGALALIDASGTVVAESVAITGRSPLDDGDLPGKVVLTPLSGAISERSWLFLP